MATYLEIRGLYNDADLINKTEVALMVASYEVLNNQDTNDPPYSQAPGDSTTASAHEKRVRLAYRVTQGGSASAARDALKLVLAANVDLSVAAIQAAPDDAFLTNVQELYDELANGLEYDQPRPTA